MTFAAPQRDLDETLWEILADVNCLGLETAENETIFRLTFPAESDTEHITRTLLQWLNERGFSIPTAIHKSIITKKNWNEMWKQFFVPVKVGSKFVILPPWEKQTAAFHPERIVIFIEPGMAFGTGTHATTQLCLTLMEKIPMEGKRVLDLGTGSGILAIAAALCGASWCLGVDIDPDIIENAAENLRLNNIPRGTVEILVGRADTLRPSNFDVILCNMLLDNFRGLIPLLPHFSHSGTLLALSGFLAAESQTAKTLVESAGFIVSHYENEAEWAALLASRQ